MNKKLVRLISEWGYELKGRELWSKRIAGYSGSFVANIRDIFDAAEYLIPIIHNSEYQNELNFLLDSK